MNIQQYAITLIFVLLTTGCSQETESPASSIQPGSKAPSAEPQGIVENVEEFTKESADIIKGNVESIEANAEKGLENSTVTNEQFDKEAEMAEKSDLPIPAVNEVENAEVEVKEVPVKK